LGRWSGLGLVGRAGRGDPVGSGNYGDFLESELKTPSSQEEEKEPGLVESDPGCSAIEDLSWK
jgi:hypothetical protein